VNVEAPSSVNVNVEAPSSVNVNVEAPSSSSGLPRQRYGYGVALGGMNDEAPMALGGMNDEAPMALGGMNDKTQACADAEAQAEAVAAEGAEVKAAEEAKADWGEGGEGSVFHGGGGEARQRRVLVADDAALNRRLLRRAFEKYFNPPWDVSEATIAPEALNAIKAAAACGRPFDLFIADENYEPADVTTGTEAIRELRSYEAAHGLPRMAVILCTGNSEAVKSHSNDGSFDLCWMKPFPKFADGTMQAAVMAMFERV